MNSDRTGNRFFRVALKLQLPIFGILILIISAQTWLNLDKARQRNERETEQQLMALYQDYNDEVRILEKSAAALSLSFAQRPDILERFHAKDRPGMLTSLEPVFTTLKTEYNIVHLQFHNPYGMVFLRLHNPDQYGDYTFSYRRANTRAIISRQTVAGIEVDPDSLGIHAVSPMFHEGLFVGLAEVGLDYDQAFLDDLKARTGADYKMWVTYREADPAGLGPLDGAPQSPSPLFFYYTGTDPTPLPIQPEHYRSVIDDGELKIYFISSNNQELAVLVAPMLGYGERIIGILEITISREEALASLRRDQLTTLILAAGLALLSLTLTWAIINFVVLRPLKHQTAVTQRQLQGDLLARVELLPRDEFGQLGHTFNVLSKELHDILQNQEAVIGERTAELTRINEQLEIEIAERMRAEQELRESTERIRAMFESITDGIVFTDLHGTILESNEAILHLHNYERKQEILGKNALEWIVESDRAGAEENFRRTRETGRSDVVEYRLLTKDGGEFHAELNTVLLRDEAGDPAGFVALTRDISERKQVEYRIQQQERLAAVGQLAAGIAHDFNNIMAVISLYTDLSLQTPNLPARVEERLETINHQARQASDLIQQILDFSRRAVIERGSLDLLIFLNEQVKLLGRTLPENIQIRFSAGEGQYTVNADPTRIQQAIMNLATNARDAMPEGGHLNIALEPLRILNPKDAPLPEMECVDWVCIKVSDTGTGIPPDVLAYIFDPFVTTKPPGEGTGLGLAQVYGIIRQHEGHVDVHTSLKEGTTFSLYLPALPTGQPDPPSPGVETPIQGQGQTILVVEDDEDTRLAMVSALELLGYRTLEAANGQQALALFETGAKGISLVLSDMVMPEMGGKILFQVLRQQDPDVRVVVMSGHPLEDAELETMRAQGLRGWLPKPPTLKQLAQAIAEVLEAD